MPHCTPDGAVAVKSCAKFVQLSNFLCKSAQVSLSLRLIGDSPIVVPIAMSMRLFDIAPDYRWYVPVRIGTYRIRACSTHSGLFVRMPLTRTARSESTRGSVPPRFEGFVRACAGGAARPLWLPSSGGRAVASWARADGLTERECCRWSIPEASGPRPGRLCRRPRERQPSSGFKESQERLKKQTA
jgi:hypothetical protein